MKQLRERESGIELLRILSIAFIYTMHISGGVQNYPDKAVRDIILWIINALCNVDITVFVLISGYFGVRYSARRLVKFHNIPWIYGILTFIALVLEQGNIFSGAEGIKEACSLLFPVIAGGKWSFMSHYFWLMAFSPFLNAAGDRLSQESYAKVLLLMTLAFSVIPTFLYFEIFEDTGKGFPYMIFIYLLGRYLGKYHATSHHSRGMLLLTAIGMIPLIVLLNAGASVIAGGFRTYFNRDLSFFILIESLSLFYLYKSFTFKSTVVNYIARASLGALKSERLTAMILPLRVIPAISSGFYFVTALLIYTLARVSIGYLIEIVRSTVFHKADEFLTDIQARSLQKISGKVMEKIDNKLHAH